MVWTLGRPNPDLGVVSQVMNGVPFSDGLVLYMPPDERSAKLGIPSKSPLQTCTSNRYSVVNSFTRMRDKETFHLILGIPLVILSDDFLPPGMGSQLNLTLRDKVHVVVWRHFDLAMARLVRDRIRSGLLFAT